MAHENDGPPTQAEWIEFERSVGNRRIILLRRRYDQARKDYNPTNIPYGVIEEGKLFLEREAYYFYQDLLDEADPTYKYLEYDTRL